MSIDHGKLLALIARLRPNVECAPWVIEELSALAQPTEAMEDCLQVPPGNGFCDQCAAGNYAQCRYIAQPAEAVTQRCTDANNCKRCSTDADTPHSGIVPPPDEAVEGAAWTPERASRLADDCLQLARNVEASKHDDAAQGAVAWHAEKTGRSSWSGNTKTSVGVSIEYPQSAADEGYTVRPLIFGDTHPQATPAQETDPLLSINPCNVSNASDTTQAVGEICWHDGYKYARLFDDNCPLPEGTRLYAHPNG